MFPRSCSILLLIAGQIWLTLNVPQTAHNKDAELWKVARQSLVRRTREYLSENPMSDRLRAFIKQIRGSKIKRQDRSNMYAIKDGEVVPVNQLEGELNTQSELGSNYTVVPLIIPIALENNVTLTEHTKDLDLEPVTAVNDMDQQPKGGILGRGRLLSKTGTTTAESPQIQTTTNVSSTEETVVDSLLEEKIKASSEASNLNKMLENMENLINLQKRGKVSSKEGALCNVTGYWDSEAGGKTFRIFKEKQETCAGNTNVTVLDKEPPAEEGFLLPDRWNITGHIPFKQSAQVILRATSNKGRKIAIFIGECRICEGSETITGDWLMSRSSTSCKDQKASHSFFSDVLRKNNVLLLQESHLRKISNSSSTTPPP